jgi:hypothetical protein
MHSSTALMMDAFSVEVDGRPGGPEDVWPGFDRHDRVGIVLRGPLDALGASALMALSVTAFYDVLRAERGDDYHRYADFYLFGQGTDVADYGELDWWPSHKHVRTAEGDAEELLRAVNDRAVTRLVVPAGPAQDGALERQTRTSALDRLRSAIAYDPRGRVEGGDLAITADRVVESYVEVVLFAGSPWVDEAAERELKAWRETLFTAPKSARETYRRLDPSDALALL